MTFSRHNIFSSNELCPPSVEAGMKTRFSLLAVSLILATLSPAQTCREVVRDSSGRVTGSSKGSGKCPGGVLVPVPPAGAKN